MKSSVRDIPLAADVRHSYAQPGLLESKKTISPWVNRDFFIGTTSVQGSVYHIGILLLNGEGFRFWSNTFKRGDGLQSKSR